ncbi:MAG: hypothetical protein RBT68_09940 [Spirochaetia bacterium]|jgi:hypothetical protein|nr:hypothetical protein [Spirochaetia bacterium]
MADLGVLKRKGYLPVASVDVSYPEYWTQMTEAAMGEDQRLILERGDGEIQAFCRALRDGKQTLPGTGIQAIWLPGLWTSTMGAASLYWYTRA